MITHRVVGEFVLARSGYLSPAHLGPFLLGNVLVDLHMVEPIKLAERVDTHFCEHMVRDGPLAFDQSAANMLANLGSLLARPWAALSEGEQAFVAGYLCHLAADEEFEQFGIEKMDRLGYLWWRELPYSGLVVLAVYNVHGWALLPDPQAASAAMASTQVPDVFAHVDHDALLAMWELVRPHALDGGTVESFVDLLTRAGFSQRDVARQRRQLAEHWDEAVAFTREFFGGVEARIEAMVARALLTLSALWETADRDASDS